MSLRIIARNSPLAIVQVREVMRQLPLCVYDLNTIETVGDREKEVSMLKAEAPTDFFTRELDDALLSGKADIAIHSAKDLPFPLPEGIKVIALTPSSNKTDALVSRGNQKLADLPHDAIVGTSSPVRKKQLLQLRPDLKITGIRGTIQERIAYIDRGETDAIIVATCALERLKLTHHIAEELPIKTHPLQGNLAITACENNHAVADMFSPIDIRRQYGSLTIVRQSGSDKALHLLNDAHTIFYDEAIDAALVEEWKMRKLHVFQTHKTNFVQNVYRQCIAGESVVYLTNRDCADEINFWEERLIPVNRVDDRTKNILCTGTGANRYNRLGLVTHKPVIAIQPVYFGEREAQKITEISFDYVIFTSKYSVQYFSEILWTAAEGIEWLDDKTVISIGENTSRILDFYGVALVEQAEEATSEGVVQYFIDHQLKKGKILLPVSELASPTIPTRLEELGYEVCRTVIYTNTRSPNYIKTLLDEIDAIVFTSPSTVRNFIEIYGSIPTHTQIICKGIHTEAAYKAVR